MIAGKAEGFLYCISSTGVTGMRKDFSSSLIEMLDSIKNYSSIPRGVGFGISEPEQIQMLKNKCEGVIVGSAIIKLIEENYKSDKFLDIIYKRVKEFVTACE